jgi:hypothetical protein
LIKLRELDLRSLKVHEQQCYREVNTIRAYLYSRGSGVRAWPDILIEGGKPLAARIELAFRMKEPIRLEQIITI